MSDDFSHFGENDSSLFIMYIPKEIGLFTPKLYFRDLTTDYDKFPHQFAVITGKDIANIKQFNL